VSEGSALICRTIGWIAKVAALRASILAVMFGPIGGGAAVFPWCETGCHSVQLSHQWPRPAVCSFDSKNVE
jgi:hypothetical protein